MSPTTYLQQEASCHDCRRNNTFFPLAFATRFLKINLGLLSIAHPALQQWPPGFVTNTGMRQQLLFDPHEGWTQSASAIYSTSYLLSVVYKMTPLVTEDLLKLKVNLSSTARSKTFSLPNMFNFNSCQLAKWFRNVYASKNICKR